MAPWWSASPRLRPTSYVTECSVGGATPADVAAPDDDDPGCGHFAGQQVLMQRDVADCGG